MPAGQFTMPARITRLAAGYVTPYIMRARRNSPLAVSHIQDEALRLPAPFLAVATFRLSHTGATLVIAAGVSVQVDFYLLGHASSSFTLERHSHVLPSIPGGSHRPS